MSEANFTTILVIDAPAAAVFHAINQPQTWWQGDIEGSTDKLNDVFTYRMQYIHYSKQEVRELKPNTKVVWLVTESHLNFTLNPSEWTGTTIIFDVTESNGRTTLTFTHVGLLPKMECYGACSDGWEQLIQQSLYSLITTGKGKKVFG